MNSQPPVIMDDYQVPITKNVANALELGRFTIQPSQGDVPYVLDQIRLQVVGQASQIEAINSVGIGCVEDLADAFIERIRLIAIPSFERDYPAAVLRGDPIDRESAKLSFEKYSEFTLGLGAIPAMGPSETKVILLTKRANAKQSLLDEGFGVITGKRAENRFPVPSDPVELNFLVAEITMPMMRFDHRVQSLKPAIIGYRFAWNKKKKQWIPFESVVYTDRNSAFSPPRL
jgi:hypothetical protein